MKLVYCQQEDFDARDRFLNCALSLGRVPNQGSCLASWALQASAVITDRYCIEQFGMSLSYVNSMNVISCCNGCVEDCSQDGNVENAFLYAMYYGVVASLLKPDACMSYFDSCLINGNLNQDASFDVSFNPCKEREWDEIPKCVSGCQSPLPFRKIKIRGVEKIFDEKKMKDDIMANGPAAAEIDLYSDLISYQTGVYSPSPNAFIVGKQTVKIVGWGSDNGTSYWLAVNSWGENWGLHGVVKIAEDANLVTEVWVPIF
ncbi:unnamed protein product [Bursaphelenchus okinawaensis]|uniref:Peptidase C1A papain C-terminal domain-containing protein n=1 Tax=Bursaphelenchus okinawaensis TaxID=465554 RepID=A0A811L997_9BILA|nr:unnamed protein product [Bursaphelenchus okinawaensis]CAG9119004.1 unnamed protein product [Bursaphelenchus okinawaensis]